MDGGVEYPEMDGGIEYKKCRMLAALPTKLECCCTYLILNTPRKFEWYAI